MDLANAIPDADFEFQLRFQRGSFAEFFGPTSSRRQILEERSHWLRKTPELCVAALPDGAPLLAEALALAAASVHPVPVLDEDSNSGVSLVERCQRLGRHWEPDFLVLKPDEAGAIRLWAGCVCFPSSWDLSEKIGLRLEDIHGVVPELNAQIGPQIHRFLTGLRPGAAWLRNNWGLSATSEMNQHPSRRLPRLVEGVTADSVWLRMEHQALVSLPKTGGILFGIRVTMHPLGQVLDDVVVRQRLWRALRTMPPAIAEYKGLTQARSALERMLQPV